MAAAVHLEIYIRIFVYIDDFKSLGSTARLTNDSQLSNIAIWDLRGEKYGIGIGGGLAIVEPHPSIQYV